MGKDELDFTTYCIGALAEHLDLSQSEVYRKLKESGILGGYIVPAYASLHTFGRTYIVEDIASLMRERGVLA